MVSPSTGIRAGDSRAVTLLADVNQSTATAIAIALLALTVDRQSHRHTAVV